MPYSSNAFNNQVAAIARLLRPSTVCDIGPGAGKYGRIMRLIAEQNHFQTKVTAVEIDQSYVDQFQLPSLYDEVIVKNAVDMITDVRCRYDLIIIGDCIEHLRKSDGVDLLNFLIYRSGYIIVIYPEALIQDDWEGHLQEAHISVWGPEDFRGWKTVHVVKDGMHLFLVRGYQDARAEIVDINDETMIFRERL